MKNMLKNIKINLLKMKKYECFLIATAYCPVNIIVFLIHDSK